jgi:hypothetical protein
VKDENGDLLAVSHDILNRWKNYLPQLLNVHKISDVRQIEIYTAELLAPYRIPFEAKLLLQSWKTVKGQVLIKFREDWFKQQVKYYSLRSTNS